MNTDAAKKVAGEAAAYLAIQGQHVGLGTGSTTAYTLAALGRRIKEEGLHITGVPTSSASERLARQHRIPLTTLDTLQHLDVAFDGADEVDPAGNLIKGRGAAHTREKVVAALARRFVVLVDESKHVAQLGTRTPVPVEVLPMAAGPVMRMLNGLGGEPALRVAVRKDGPVVTDQGFWIVDVHFNGISDPVALALALDRIPGVLDHGLFISMATDLITGRKDGSWDHHICQAVPDAR